MDQGGVADSYLTMQIIDNIDAGVVMLDKAYRVLSWNTFMQAYSGISDDQIIGKNLFSVVPDLPETWLKNKIQSTFKLGTRSFSCWEDRPHVFQFSNFSPITGGSSSMYQNLILTPLKSGKGAFTHICLMLTDVSDIAKSKNHLRESNAQLTHLSMTDRLTQLYNRGHWESCLSDAFDYCHKTQQPASLVMFDIDHFKLVNDTFGHVIGDAVIKNISSILRRTKRQSDMAGRYGGEEFGIILPQTTAELALCFTERLRQRVEEDAVTVDVRDVKVTISLGICEWSPRLKNYEHWLECADAALYKSKKSGRNQSAVHYIAGVNSETDMSSMA
ncbi:diguanylate cyclase [Photobacterium japonica]|uniref:sensor domain-containing diguanylate cyclase n=1 Tax=Photobacterium japonica TaxID=2910235 RepID=UPI003D0FE70D